jgi:hypothetical protein
LGQVVKSKAYIMNSGSDDDGVEEIQKGKIEEDNVLLVDGEEKPK